VDSRYFAEGLVEWNGRLFQLTWEANMGFIYEMGTFRQVGTFSYPGEGWGLTHDGRRLVMSDGSATLRLLDSETQQQTGLLNVRDGDQAVADLNELEFVKGSIYANVWQTDRIAIITPDTGRVTGWVDLAGLLTESEKTGTDVLNGIAYDAEGDRLFVTGKLWPKLFEIRLRPARIAR
jgi:glutamine cyclotransferase